MSGGTEFNRSKFKELSLYLSQASAADEGFGMVKLNKLLFRADFEAYRILGRSITGATYEKQEFGPVARDLPIVLDELASERRIAWEFPASGPYTRKVPTVSSEADAQPDETLFSDDEKSVIDATLQELSAMGGKAVSEWSHQTSVGWLIADIGEEIDYASARIATTPPDESVLAALRAFDSAP